MKFVLDNEDEDDDVVVSRFRRCYTTVVIRLRSVDGGIGTKYDDSDRRVAVGSR